MESVSRISSMLETARDLTLEAAREATPRISSRPLTTLQIKKLLDSRHERDVLDGLRRVIAFRYTTPPSPTLPFFPAVLKTLSNPYPSTRPLVYLFLVQHAEEDPDTALLAINTVQKALGDTNPRVRAMALRTMSAIRVPVISQIVSLAIKKGVSDLSPLVRKAAALACVKCLRLDPATRPQMEEYIAVLLADKQYYVAGAAVQAFMEICPEKLELIHPVYRRLCRMIVDMDEWGQLAVLRLMTRYARLCFPRRVKRVKKVAVPTQEERSRDFYEEIEPTREEEEKKESDYENQDIVEPDLTLFLTSIRPLLQSRSSAIILAVTRAYLYLSPTTHLALTIGPLIALLRSSQDIQQIALCNIVQVCLLQPTLFAMYPRHFLLREAIDPPTIMTLKLEVFTLLFPHLDGNFQDLILAELEHFSHSHDPTLVRESVRAIGRCAQVPSRQTSRRCMTLLLKQIHSPDANLVGEAVEVVRHLIQRAPGEHRGTVVRLAKNLDSLTSSTARASVIWLVGEFSGGEAEGGSIAADVLRILVRGYADETDEVRGQIVELAAKIYLHHLNAKNAKTKALDVLNQPDVASLPLEEEGGFTPKLTVQHPIELLYQHTMLLAHYTPSYSLRDRARFHRALLSNPSNTDLASLLLLAPKPVPQARSPSESRRNFTLGGASLVVGEFVAGGEMGQGEGEGLPEWVKEGEEPDARLRDDDFGGGEKEYAGPKVVAAGKMLDEALQADRGLRGDGGGASKGGTLVRKEKTLDAWLDEEEEEEDDDESEESEESSEEDEEEESEYETDSEDEEGAAMVR